MALAQPAFRRLLILPLRSPRSADQSLQPREQVEGTPDWRSVVPAIEPRTDFPQDVSKANRATAFSPSLLGSHLPVLQGRIGVAQKLPFFEAVFGHGLADETVHALECAELLRGQPCSSWRRATSAG